MKQVFLAVNVDEYMLLTRAVCETKCSATEDKKEWGELLKKLYEQGGIEYAND